MKRYLLLVIVAFSTACNLDYLDPTVLQTKTPPNVQQEAAIKIISKYLPQAIVEVNPLLFKDKKDVFSLRTIEGQLHIRASTGVAAVWGFNYYLKKYCNSQIAWQVKHINIPNPLPPVDEVVIASDRFRYYQNVCTESYSFVWWNTAQWEEHIEWMALNGINLSLAPVAQEAAWARVYTAIGMTQEEINLHFTGPAFLSWLRMGNLRGWGGPLPQSWHDKRRGIQEAIVDYMFRLGIVPVFPAFNGHVPRAFSRIYPNTTLHTVQRWNNFADDYCCDYFLDPHEPLFTTIGTKFLREITGGSSSNHIYVVDPFNEMKIDEWSTTYVKDTAKAIFTILNKSDDKAVWMVPNWMFVQFDDRNHPTWWDYERVKAFLTSVPNGRMLVLDLQSEQWPQYYLYDMYLDQPFIWCMLHNFGGTLGMFGSIQTINSKVYEARSAVNSTMIGIGLTPEGINQNYVVYDLMLEAGWRTEPVKDLEAWVSDYARRRYGCEYVSVGWKYLLRSVYNFEGVNRISGKYVITMQPSFAIEPWAWYKSKDLFDAFREFTFASQFCWGVGLQYDVVDITRQALQYRAEQIYVKMVQYNRYGSTWAFNATVNQFLDIMNDLEIILSTHPDFQISKWLENAKRLAGTEYEAYIYELNARNQITLWGPNGELTDYAGKQWAEVFHYYYTPRWRAFLSAALDAKLKNEASFDEFATREIIRETVEKEFMHVDLSLPQQYDTITLSKKLYKKWATVPGLVDLPLIEEHNDGMADMADHEITSKLPSVTMIDSKIS